MAVNEYMTDDDYQLAFRKNSDDRSKIRSYLDSIRSSAGTEYEWILYNKPTSELTEYEKQLLNMDGNEYLFSRREMVQAANKKNKQLESRYKGLKKEYVDFNKTQAGDVFATPEEVQTAEEEVDAVTGAPEAGMHERTGPGVTENTRRSEWTPQEIEEWNRKNRLYSDKDEDIRAKMGIDTFTPGPGEAPVAGEAPGTTGAGGTVEVTTGAEGAPTTVTTPGETGQPPVPPTATQAPVGQPSTGLGPTYADTYGKAIQTGERAVGAIERQAQAALTGAGIAAAKEGGYTKGLATRTGSSMGEAGLAADRQAAKFREQSSKIRADKQAQLAQAYTNIANIQQQGANVQAQAEENRLARLQAAMKNQ